MQLFTNVSKDVLASLFSFLKQLEIGILSLAIKKILSPWILKNRVSSPTQQSFITLYFALQRVRVILKQPVIQLVNEMYVHIVPVLSAETSWERDKSVIVPNPLDRNSNTMSGVVGVFSCLV
jgi:phage-related protein